MSDAVIDQLRKVTEGLLYQSESDEPFETFSWERIGKSLGKEAILQASGNDPSTPTNEVPVDQFFADLTTPEDRHTEEEKAVAAKYRTLLGTLKGALSELRVFKIGEVNVSIYIVGKTASGRWTGVKTKAVET
jgi:Nuclease A inhibitor-like protein